MERDYLDEEYVYLDWKEDEEKQGKNGMKQKKAPAAKTSNKNQAATDAKNKKTPAHEGEEGSGEAQGDDEDGAEARDREDLGSGQGSGDFGKDLSVEKLFTTF